MSKKSDTVSSNNLFSPVSVAADGCPGEERRRILAEVPLAELLEFYDRKSVKARGQMKAMKAKGDDEEYWIAMGELFALDDLRTMLLARVTARGTGENCALSESARSGAEFAPAPCSEVAEPGAAVKKMNVT